MNLDVGLSVRICRIKYNVTNITVAKALGVRPQVASNISNRQHSSTRTVEKLAAVFGLTPLEFLAVGVSDDEQRAGSK